MKMKENYKILAEFIKDMSSETPDVQTYLFVRENISKYHLAIDIHSKAIKNKMIEVNTTLKFQDSNANEKRSFFEIVYSTIIRVEDEVTNKKDLQKIILCDVQNKIYPNLEKVFLNLLSNSGYPGVKLERKIDFENLYNKKFN